MLIALFAHSEFNEILTIVIHQRRENRFMEAFQDPTKAETEDERHYVAFSLENVAKMCTFSCQSPLISCINMSRAQAI